MGGNPGAKKAKIRSLTALTGKAAESFKEKDNQQSQEAFFPFLILSSSGHVLLV